MKILFLSAADNIHTVRWVNALSEKGNDVHLVFLKNHKPSENKISDKVHLYPLKFSATKGYFLNAYQLNKLYKKINPDIVNAHYASGYGTLARYAKLKPLILSVWGSDVYDFPYQSKLKFKILKKNLLYADQITSTSNIMAKQLELLTGQRVDNINVIPFGVDLIKFSRTKYDVKKEEIIVGNIKSLKKIYGIDDLIKATKILKNNLSDKMDIKKIKVKIYGDGEQRQELIKLVTDLGLENIVFFMGKIPNSEVPKVLEEFDVFCATSLQESFGVALVEAMSMELPVVATDVDGFKEVIDDRINGIIVEKRNPYSIAEALGQLILNKEMRFRMGKNGRKKVIENYNWDQNVDTMLKLYNSIMEKDVRL